MKKWIAVVIAIATFAGGLGLGYYLGNPFRGDPDSVTTGIFQPQTKIMAPDNIPGTGGTNCTYNWYTDPATGNTYCEVICDQ